MSQSERARELNIDLIAEDARALHRVVRAMHDGHCPACGHLADATEFQMRAFRSAPLRGHRCPECSFQITQAEEEAALKAFAPHFRKSLELFEQWRQGGLAWRELALPSPEAV